MSTTSSIIPSRGTPVRALLGHSAVAGMLVLRAGEKGLDAEIDHPRIQKSGLVFAGHNQGLVASRVQVLGETELSFIESLPLEDRKKRITEFFALRIACTLVTRGVEPPEELIAEAERTQSPLLVSKTRSSHTIACVHSALDDLFAPTTSMHGVLVDIHGLGTLLVGRSGIGKSECALFLVERGHRLVADDRVRLRRTPDGLVVGSAEPLLRHHLEIRGLGILNVRDLYGAPSVRETVSVDLVVELSVFGDDEPIDRLGLDVHKYDLLGVPLPFVKIPVRPGRDLSVLLEVAARNELLKRGGNHGAKNFAERLAQGLGIPNE